MAPYSVRSRFFVKGKWRADKQWAGTARSQKSEFFHSVCWQLRRHVVCRFPSFCVRRALRRNAATGCSHDEKFLIAVEIGRLAPGLAALSGVRIKIRP